MEEEIQTGYTIKTEAFSGPFDLLLELIENKKLFVNEISLAEITADYIEHVRKMESLDLGQATHFAVVAATLILIKSKSLLPNLPLTKEEETSIDDLELRLKLYQAIKDIAPYIKEKYGKVLLLPLPDRPVGTVLFSPDKNLKKESIESAILNVLGSLPVKVNLPEVTVKTIVSIEEMISSLEERITSTMTLSFKEFSYLESSEAKEVKIHTIVSFLALLELVRTGIIDVMQTNAYDDITISKQIENI